MKIKNALIIPVIAILIAVFTLGAVPGIAADTTNGETEVSDSLTYVPTTFPPTSSLEEEVEGMVSNMFGDTIQGAEEPVRGISRYMAKLLDTMRNIINYIISILETSGGMLGGSDIFSNGLF